MLGRVRERARDLWRRALAERATPRGLGWSVAVGVFVGCTPLVGLHAGIAVGLATALRLNRLWAFLGSRVSSVAVLPWIVVAEIQVAHRLRVGAWASMLGRAALDHAGEYALDWWLGTPLVGGALAAGLGGLAYALARRQAAARAPAAP